VAAGVVPVAVGTQTNGSVLRPASICGVYGFKPSCGELPRTGTFPQSPSLDELGLFARSLDDMALVGECLTGDDGHDPALAGPAPRRWFDVAPAAPPLPPRFAFVRTPWWGCMEPRAREDCEADSDQDRAIDERMEPQAREDCEAFVQQMQGLVEEVPLPDVVERAGVARHRQRRRTRAGAAPRVPSPGRCPQSHATCAPAPRARHPRYRLPAGVRPHSACGGGFEEYFDRNDAIQTWAALGAAPRGLDSAGDPIKQTE